ncbi:putative membrane protein DUF2306 [Ruegeria sp. P4]|nr:putative membrane protein DUF2306 [Ruegeria sp. P4]
MTCHFWTKRRLAWGLGTLWVLSILIALGSLRFLVAEMSLVMPAMVHHLLAHSVVLYLHIGLAPVALALLPVQFSHRLRGRRPGLHRWGGRLYALCVLMSGLASLWLAYTTAEGVVAGFGFALLAVAWLATTAMAVIAALQRRFAQHRAWMIRSAALTLAAVTLRLYLPIGMITAGFEASYPVIAWICWVPNLLAAEWLLLREARGAVSAG